MQKIDTMSSSALDPAKTDWDFVEVWIDIALQKLSAISGGFLPGSIAPQGH